MGNVSRNSEDSSILPEFCRELVTFGAVRHTFPETEKQPFFVETAQPWMGYKSYSSSPVVVLFLDELVVPRSAAKFRRYRYL